MYANLGRYKGSLWHQGTTITGTNTTAAVFSGSGITQALPQDMYLNTDTGNVYECVTGGDAATATWKYVGSIKGVKGDKGDTGEAAIELEDSLESTSTEKALTANMGNTLYQMMYSAFGELANVSTTTVTTSGNTTINLAKVGKVVMMSHSDDFELTAADTYEQIATIPSGYKPKNEVYVQVMENETSTPNMAAVKIVAPQAAYGLLNQVHYISSVAASTPRNFSMMWIAG